MGDTQLVPANGEAEDRLAGRIDQAQSHFLPAPDVQSLRLVRRAAVYEIQWIVHSAREAGTSLPSSSHPAHHAPAHTTSAGLQLFERGFGGPGDAIEPVV